MLWLNDIRSSQSIPLAFIECNFILFSLCGSLVRRHCLRFPCSHYQSRHCLWFPPQSLPVQTPSRFLKVRNCNHVKRERQKKLKYTTPPCLGFRWKAPDLINTSKHYFPRHCCLVLISTQLSWQMPLRFSLCILPIMMRVQMRDGSRLFLHL